MAKLNYPSKPWNDGQRAMLLPDLQFAYSQSLKKWVPISPGTVDNSQIEEAFGVSSINELLEKFTNLDVRVNSIDSDLKYYGRIWKTAEPPLTNVNDNDVWVDIDTNIMYSWDENSAVWIQLQN